MLMRLGQAVAGLAVLALGIMLLITARGPDPWGVFLLGLQGRLGLSLGYTALGGGVLLIAINFFWGGRRPGLATLLSMMLVAALIDLFGLFAFFGASFSLWQRALLQLLGIVTMAAGIAIYVRARLGEGPVEGLMFVLSHKLNLKIAVAKVLEDCLFVVGGLLLGWQLQPATIVTALSVGPVTQVMLSLPEKVKKKKEDASI